MASAELECVSLSEGDYQMLHDAARAFVESLPLCERCKEGGRPAFRATHVSVLDHQPVCEDHSCVGDTKLVDRTALRRLLAVLST